MLLFRLYVAYQMDVMIMDGRMDLLLMSAARLYSMGIDLEAARERLNQLSEQGLSCSSQEMLEANQDFERLELLWKELERQHLELRDEIIRDMSAENRRSLL